MPDSRLRLRRVRFKDGRAPIEVFSRPDWRPTVERAIQQVLDAQSDIAGMAIVVWGADGGSTAAVKNFEGSPLTQILIPDFVRARLTAEITELWTRHGLHADGIF